MHLVGTKAKCTWCGKVGEGTDRTWTGKVSQVQTFGHVCNHCWAAFLQPTPRSKCTCRTHRILRGLRT